jgi:hypothetical protein
MQNLHRAVAVLLTSLLSCSCSPVFAATLISNQTSTEAASGHRRSGRMSQHAKALHALDRLTFGPHPGEVKAVEAMGVDRWIDLQLHPEKIDDNALEQRLTAYKARCARTAPAEPIMAMRTSCLFWADGSKAEKFMGVGRD